ncbi:MAG: hypothetical protein VKP62_04170 [Candidatus Sericytochromatia bacterium]|nr:hypothetical protein [Candidatus Sericytochromatia bacterium]
MWQTVLGLFRRLGDTLRPARSDWSDWERVSTHELPLTPGGHRPDLVLRRQGRAGVQLFLLEVLVAPEASLLSRWAELSAQHLASPGASGWLLVLTVSESCEDWARAAIAEHGLSIHLLGPSRLPRPADAANSLQAALGALAHGELGLGLPPLTPLRGSQGSLPPFDLDPSPDSTGR